MQTDFHYYCLAVLAKTAGFTASEALTIAYASQYVDDAVESKPLHVGKLLFDPVRTATLGIRSYTWGTQKMVFMPFHFLPPKPVLSEEDTFIVEPDSMLARMLLTEALNEPDKKFMLYRLGIALHTYADTWTHRGFSGGVHHLNDVTNIWIWDAFINQWIKPFWANVLLDFGPHIGHAEAGTYPDIAFLKWKYTQKKTRQVIERNNPMDFLEAAYQSYKALRKAAGGMVKKAVGWEGIKHKLYEGFSNAERSLERRCAWWKKEFQHLFYPYPYEYNRLEWRRKALLKKSATKDQERKIEFAFPEPLYFEPKKKFAESHWVHFHRAALKQRNFVLEHLY